MSLGSDDRPIGVFDSGVGGLTTVRELIRIMPNENIVYFGDTGRVPYGTKSDEIIKKYAEQDISFLISENVKIIIIACGTVSSVYDLKNNNFSIPIVKLIYPTCLKAKETTKNGKIGVIGTSATIRSKSYRKELAILDEKLNIFDRACPLFVPLIESGFIKPTNQIAQLTVEHYLKGLKQEGIDTLILGCTHYPIISQTIANYMGNSVKLINSGEETAKYTKEYLVNNKLNNSQNTKGSHKFYVSDDVEGFNAIASVFLDNGTSYITRKIAIENYGGI